jgi:hypothetical protein
MEARGGDGGGEDAAAVGCINEGCRDGRGSKAAAEV